MIFKKKDTRTELEKEIDEVKEVLRNTRLDDPNYKQLLKLLKELEELHEAEKTPEKPLDPNTVVSVLGSLGGILLILGYEHGHVITSKALNFVLKGRF